VLPAAAGEPVAGPEADEWPAYGRDPGGARFSPLADIDRSNVTKLEVAWTFRTGHLGIETGNDPRFEPSPIVVDGSLYLTTPLGQLITLDPATGSERCASIPSRAPMHITVISQTGA
jgi:quinoprotein glucose dehydrogenase